MLYISKRNHVTSNQTSRGSFLSFRFRPPAFFSTPCGFLPLPASGFPFGRFSPPFFPDLFSPSADKGRISTGASKPDRILSPCLLQRFPHQLPVFRNLPLEQKARCRAFMGIGGHVHRFHGARVHAGMVHTGGQAAGHRVEIPAPAPAAGGWHLDTPPAPPRPVTYCPGGRT